MNRLNFVIVIFLSFILLIGCDKQQLTLSLEDKEINLNVNETYELNAVVTGLDKYTLEYSFDENGIVEVHDGVIKALQEGEVIITISIKGYNGVPSVNIKVVINALPSIEISGENEVEVNKEIHLNVTLANLEEVEWISSDSNIATVEKGVVKGIKEGKVTITARSGEYSDSLEITVILVPDTIAPEFILGDNFMNMIKLNWNKEFDPLAGITALDNIDGDITDRIKIIKNFNNQEYGVQTIELSITDNSGNTSTMTRQIEVVWNYDVKFVGHAGSYYGLMNSEEAIMYAIQVLKYQVIEVDLKQTSDGVFILSHDDTFGGYNLATTTWDVLKEVEVTAARNAGIPASNGSVKNSPYTTKLLSLDRFLEICRENNVEAIIELKYSNGISNNDQSRMGALMEVIEAANMREKVIFLGSQYNALIWTRNNGYEDVRCQYLVNSFESETILQRCIDYNLDISTNVTSTHSNSEEWLAKYKEAGLEVAVYTFTQYVNYPVVQEWIDKGVNYVTVDWHLMSELNLPESSIEPVETFEVIFKDYNGTVLKTVEVLKGRTAAPPTTPSRVGYEFIGWDKDITDINSDLEVNANYELSTYSIIYDANNTTLQEASWENKAEFIEDFYGDLYNWFIASGNKLERVTITDNNVKVVKNGVTVEFNTVKSLKDINIYDFEKTISNYIYKPVVRASDGTTMIENSEGYFLNSSLYREKYLEMDAYFVNAIKVGYPTYDNTYKPTSAGKIQIMFRFQQWQQGTNIPAFDKLPVKYVVTEDLDLEYLLPTTHNTFTVEDEFDLPLATANYEFIGWFLDKEGTQPFSKITSGTTGNLVVYAKWGNRLNNNE